jgi:benzoate-CoA ligase
MSVAADLRARHDRMAESDPRAVIDAIPRDYNFAADVLARNLDAGRADKPAYIDPRGSWTYGQLADRVERFGHLLRSLGLQPEERILICLLDTIDWPTAFLGAIKAGVVAVPVNTLMTEADYRFMLADSRARLLVVSAALYPKFAGLIGAAPDLRHVIVSGDDAHGHHRFEDLLAKASGEPSTAATTRDDMCFWLYTSGSTGKPKGAVHVHADLRLTDDLYAGPTLGLNDTDVCHSVAKLFFAYGLGNALTFPLSVGATTVLNPERPTPDAVAALLKKHGVTTFYAVPTFYAAFLASSGLPQAGEVKLRRCVSAGEALPPDVGRRWSERFGVDILDGLGSTEMLHIFLSNRPGDVRYGTSGKPVPGYDLRIVGDDGLPVKAGELGELQVRGPTSAVMYWNNRAQSRSTFLGEWTRSGDKTSSMPTATTSTAAAPTTC